MSEKRGRKRKQPFTCIPDLDALDNIEVKGNGINPSPARKSCKENNGKENFKESTKKSKLKKKVKEDVDTDSDSEAEYGQLWSVLRKSGIKVREKSDSCLSTLEPTTPKHNSYDSQAYQKTDNKLATKGRKRLYSDDSNNEKLDVTPAKRSRRVSTISQGSVERNNCARSINHRKNSEKTPAKDNKVTPIKICKVHSPKPTDEKIMVVLQQQKNEDRGSDTLSGYITPVKKKTNVTSNENFTPSRHTSKCKTPKTPLENARISLHVAAVPSSLPCRENEFQNILNFVENKVMDGVGGCMYISGVPGTGKTATVTQVIRRLQEASITGSLPQFKYIEINGMKLSDPRQAYVQLYQKIFEKNDRISSDAAQKKLDGYFNKADRKKKTTVLLVDELDLMCNRKQDVVYNLLDWPSKPYSRFVVLTIANTMDMPERKLKGRVNSRLGLTRLTFLPYTHKQLEEIVLARLQGTDAFVLDAVRLATRKVAAVSGDARRALDICRRAAELPNANEPVRITHIEQAIKEMTNSNIVRLIRSCSELEKLFLKSVSDVCLRTGLEEVDLLQIVEHLLPMCVLTGLERPPIPGVLGLCHRLKCFRLLFTNNHRGGLLQRITLNLTQDDLHYALKAETEARN